MAFLESSVLCLSVKKITVLLTNELIKWMRFVAKI